jgi:hypothetical protein
MRSGCFLQKHSAVVGGLHWKMVCDRRMLNQWMMFLRKHESTDV